MERTDLVVEGLDVAKMSSSLMLFLLVKVATSRARYLGPITTYLSDFESM